MEEIWKNIPEYEGYYQASDLGRIKNVKTNKILKLYQNKRNKYIQSSLCKNGVCRVLRTHRLIAKTFLKNPNNYPCINHIDGDKTNNKVTNLEWCTQKHNVKEAWRMGLCKPSENQKKAARKFCQTKKIKKVAQYNKKNELIKIWKSQKEASIKTNISKTAINNNVVGLSKSAGGYIWVMI